MKLTKLSTYALSAALLLGTWACNNDDENVDTTAPEIKMEEMPTTVQAGQELHLHLNITDNEALSEARVSIHNNFDGHSHGRLMAAFSFDEVYALEGKNQDLEADIAIPAETISGNYHLSIMALDAQGNEAEAIFHEFEIANSSQPTITLSSPTNAQEVEEGQEITLMGSVQDPDGLDHVEIKVVKDEEHDHDEDGHDDHDHGDDGHDHEDEPLVEAEYELEGAQNWNLNQITFTIPADDHDHDHGDEEEEHKDLKLRVTAKDNNGNYKTVIVKLHMH